MANEPVLRNGVIASISGTVVSLGVTVGLFTADQGATIGAGIAAAITAGSAIAAAVPPIIAAWHARSKVTPVSAPTPVGKHEAP